MTLAMTGKMLPYKKDFGLMASEVFHIPFPHQPFGVSVADSLKAIDLLFKSSIDPSRIAAIVIEPVQGEGGFIQAPTELMIALRKLCDQHGIMLIDDEIQAGFGRTGKMFAIEHSGVVPDLITIAKSLAGGFPLSGVVGKAAIMDAPDPGGLGSTYAGSPISCAAALAVLDVFEQENLLERANVIGERLRTRLTKISMRNDIQPIAFIRGPGAMVAFDVVKADGNSSPDAEATKRLVSTALDDGLVLLSSGLYANTIRILVPLTASDNLIDEGMDKIEQALVKIASI